ncbi:MAG: hypothetical protein ABW223_04860 [Rariglobus sp.]
MARQPKLYQKLVRRRGGVGTYHSLWLASDHVLMVEANMMTERYQRVWFRDVQGFFVQPSMQSRWVTGIGLLFFVVFGGLALAGGPVSVALWGVAGLSGLVALYGFIFARTCRFHVLTAVQKTQWPNVARRRQVAKLLARLEPLIRDAQKADTVPPPMPQAATETESAVSAPI